MTHDIVIPGAAGDLPARIYRPEGTENEKLPVIVYWHGGGWVIANIDVYDGGPRSLAKLANAIVVSCHYRQAPENKFPAAHDDAFAQYQWIRGNTGVFSSDGAQIAVAGESAGANLAINVAIAARDAGIAAPVHMALVYPVAGNDVNTPSYRQNADAKPLSKPMMEWFVKHTFASAFESYSIAVYRSYLTRYAGQTLKVTGSNARAPDDFIVTTNMVDPNDHSGNAPLEIDFRVRTDTGKPELTDLNIMGVWLALSEREAF